MQDVYPDEHEPTVTPSNLARDKPQWKVTCACGKYTRYTWTIPMAYNIHYTQHLDSLAHVVAKAKQVYSRIVNTPTDVPF